jgi:hypothetical protein
MEHDEATRTVHRLASLMPRGAGVGLSTSMVRHGQVDHGSGVAREGDGKPDDEQDSAPDAVLDSDSC